MMLSLKLAANPRRLTLAPVLAVKKLIKPPGLKLLPRRTYTKGLLLSGGFHAVLIAALIWLPMLLPSPVVVEDYRDNKPAAAADYEPLVMPKLPQLAAVASGGTTPSVPRVRAAAASGADSPPLKRDYAGPQEIGSYLPHAVNRVQTIRRPDLVAPPNLKFPLRLQSMVMLPAQAVPVLAPRPKEEARQAPPKPIAPEPTVEMPKLVSVPVAPAEAVPPKAIEAPQPAASSSVAAEAQVTP